MYANISSKRGELGPILRFAGGPLEEWPSTLWRSIRFVILPMFKTSEANNLRLVCKEIKKDIEEYPWKDMKTLIKGNINNWRNCFPNAKGANVTQYHYAYNPSGRRTPVVDENFLNFVGLEELDIPFCLHITDAAFTHLSGIKKLNMQFCHQITDAAFIYLEGIHTLNISGIPEKEKKITDEAFKYLKGIKNLNMHGCNQLTITDAAFKYLEGIHTLNMSSCDQPTITNEAFKHLKGIHTLKMPHCSQKTITDEAFKNLKGIHTLNIAWCPQLSNMIFVNLSGIDTLNMSEDLLLSDMYVLEYKLIKGIRSYRCEQYI